MKKGSGGLALLLLLSMLSLHTIMNLPEEVSALTPHDTIYVSGNENFTTDNGVTGGSGTWTDPYIIEDWEVNASTANGIEIRDTDLHFIIRDAYVHAGGWDYDGIRLHNVTNGRVENVTLTANYFGIYSEFPTNVSILGNDILNNNYMGIRLDSSADITIAANNLSSNGARGIRLDKSGTNITVENNNVSKSANGIGLWHLTNATIASNIVSANDEEGIQIAISTNSTIIGNDVAFNGMEGILIAGCDNVTVKGNSVTSSADEGIHIAGSVNVTVTENVLTSDGLVLNGDTVENFNTHVIAPDNLVNGKPVLYYKDCSALEVDGVPVGQLIFANCTNIRAANLQIADTDSGIQMAYVHDAVVEDNNVSRDDWVPIIFQHSSNMTLLENTVQHANWHAIRSHYSTNITVVRNNLSLNKRNAICFTDSTNVTIRDNHIISNNGNGIVIISGTYTDILGNIVSANKGGGIASTSSAETAIVGNYLVSNNWSAIGQSASRGLLVERNVVSNSRRGVIVSSSTDVIVRDNEVSDHERGIVISSSSQALVYHNVLSNNTLQASDDGGDVNSWDNGYPSGGNYWADYVGTDNCSGHGQDVCPDPDGIGDVSYGIDADSQDRYPIMSPFGIVPPRPPTILMATLSGNDSQNLTITWSLSPDDGMGLKSVVGYKVYRNMSYDSGGLKYEPISFTSNGTSFHVDGGAGEGDSSNRFYYVCAVSAFNRSSCSSVQVGKFTRPLTPGQTLLSVPLIQSDGSVETVLQTVQYDKAWYYDSSSQEWKWYMKSKGYRRGLFNINHTMGIWVNVTESSNLTVAGIVPAQTTIRLHSGWNLVSCPSFNTTYTVADLKAGIGATRVEGHDPAPPHHLRVLGDAEVLQTGEAYWVVVDAEVDWIVEVSWSNEKNDIPSCKIGHCPRKR